ncbi:hypothetical protein DM860_002512 [Cuscuta australis]|uniref:TOG domain-containing protein n=1 Tax=Cuscuta australis TaxID=267555 RepID=A0A328CZ26_9ASTE|nr:hypothetical protein DM860_002512 [Cuscuta australis]
MALKPLDNALQVIPERPKKLAKIATLTKNPNQKIQNQTDFSGLNDENKPPLPEAAVDYLPSDKLEALANPDLKIQDLALRLDSKDWLKVCESLNDVRRFTLFHSTLLEPILKKVLLVMVKAMKNPRSALCKTSIMASSDIFKAFGNKLLIESEISDAFDQVLLQLLLKASQDKKFVCEEADRALKEMVGSMTPLLLLKRLQSYVKHSNPRVRAKAAISISECFSIMELEGMTEFGLVPSIQTAVDLLNDRLPEARESARRIAVCLYEAVTAKEEQKQEAWQSFCCSNLSAIHAQSMVKLVSSH